MFLWKNRSSRGAAASMALSLPGHSSPGLLEESRPRDAPEHQNGHRLTIALAGNANVGKSVIFNQLTGSKQIIGNWPGKTVERAEGSLHIDGCDITIVDLPGIYSL